MILAEWTEWTEWLPLSRIQSFSCAYILNVISRLDMCAMEQPFVSEVFYCGWNIPLRLMASTIINEKNNFAFVKDFD
jgi:hypothetical protein